MAKGGFQVKVKRTGRVQVPRLDGGQMQELGETMVAAQKARWAKGMDADGVIARQLSKSYSIVKKKYRNVRGTPLRDNRMTGVLVKNFTLRKAIGNTIRAENTSREGRAHANRAQGYEQMIGLAASDQVVIFRKAQDMYGSALKRAWVPIG